jgi:hypothetical protein
MALVLSVVCSISELMVSHAVGQDFFTPVLGRFQGYCNPEAQPIAMAKCCPSLPRSESVSIHYFAKDVEDVFVVFEPINRGLRGEKIVSPLHYDAWGDYPLTFFSRPRDLKVLSVSRPKLRFDNPFDAGSWNLTNIFDRVSSNTGAGFERPDSGSIHNKMGAQLRFSSTNLSVGDPSQDSGNNCEKDSRRGCSLIFVGMDEISGRDEDDAYRGGAVFSVVCLLFWA